MSHAIMREIYPATWTLKKITDDVINFVQTHGDRYGTDRLRVPTERVFDNIDEANAYIDNADKGWYDGIAVKFLDYTGVSATKKITEYEDKITDILQKKKEYIKAHSVHQQKAAYIGCPDCGSKLNKDKLRGEHCPLCGQDLRAESTLERINSFDVRVNELNAKIAEERKKQKAKATVKYLVKYEYHC